MTRWNAIRGYEGYYEVASDGHVRSLPRVIIRKDGIRQTQKGRILRSSPKKVGKQVYMIVALCKEGHTHFQYVHRLVAEAFIPNPLDLPEVNHKDLNKANNAADNLEWSSSAGNKQHAVRNGVKFNPNPKRGEDAGAATLTWKEVRRMRKLANKHTRKELAEMFNTSKANVGFILTNKTWIENQEGLTIPKVDSK